MNVEVKDLKRHFGTVQAVNGVSFSFGSGDVFGFIGPNGAGKTTTMRILATLDEASDGDAFVDGISVTEYPEQVRRLVGFVPDALPVQPDMTVHEYLDFFARAYGLQGSRRTRAVGEIEEFTGLHGLREKLVTALSKGMKQRVCVARALIHEPGVLVLDEPAAGLDPRARVELRELLQLLGQQNKAILISSHILTELTEICNGVVIIENGEILETGTLADVTARAAATRTIAVRALCDSTTLLSALLQQPTVADVRHVNGEIHADLSGTEEDSAALLATLLRDGVRVVEFRQIRADLEDIFMKVTKGQVQ